MMSKTVSNTSIFGVTFFGAIAYNDDRYVLHLKPGVPVRRCSLMAASQKSRVKIRQLYATCNEQKGFAHKMELILINESKLKVMLTPEDMRRFDISCDTIDYDNTETRRAFWSILDEAKYRTGFDAASDRVFIQVYPSKEGGCEMYITKLGGFGGDETDNPDIKKCFPKRSPARVRTVVYRFEKLEPLLAVCAKLRHMGYLGKSSAYAARQKSVYYLVITEKTGYLGSFGMGEYAFVAEYGQIVNTYGILAYITEHCQCLSPENAVEELSALY